MADFERAITVANDETVAAMIAGAQRRVVAVAPAVSKRIADAITERWTALGAEAVSVIIDVDPEVYRLGFGDFEAVELLEKASASLGTTLNRHDGIRIGLIIVDDSTMVYSPNAELVEAGPEQPSTPNAIMIGAPPPALEREVGQGPRGTRDQVVGLDKAEKAKIEEVKDDLARNPPQKFDIARTVRVFNAYFEFVDFELRGLQIQRRTVSIPSDLMGLAKDKDTQQRLQASFKLIGDTSALSGKPFQECKTRLVQEYLTQLPNYGYVVLRAKKPRFEQKIGQLRRAIERFQNHVTEELQQALDQSRTTLMDALLPSATSAPPKRWHKHFEGEISDSLARRLLDGDLQRAFRSAEDLVKEMKVKVVFKGVTFESLQDEDFIRVAQERLPALEELHTEYDAAKAQRNTTQG